MKKQQREVRAHHRHLSSPTRYVLAVHEQTEERLALMLFLRLAGLEAFGARDEVEASLQRDARGIPSAVVVTERRSRETPMGGVPSFFIPLESVQRWLTSSEPAMPAELAALRAVLEARTR
jgi:hypothetical protein